MPAPVDPVVKACLLRLAGILWMQAPPFSTWRIEKLVLIFGA